MTRESSQSRRAGMGPSGDWRGSPAGTTGRSPPSSPTRSTAGLAKPAESLQSIKEHVKGRIAGGHPCSLEECKRLLRDVVAASEAQASEDFHLLTSLAEQVAQVGQEDTLVGLTRGAPDFATETRELIDSILFAQERDAGGARHVAVADSHAGNTGVAAERVRRKVNQRLVDLIDIVSVCRAERVKLLAELVTASRNRAPPASAAFTRLSPSETKKVPI